MDRDKTGKITVLALPSDGRRNAGRLRSVEDRSRSGRSRVSLFSNSQTGDIWGRVNTDIATFLAAVDALATEDSEDNYQSLLAATDRLLWASARTRLEVERILGERKKGTAVRRISG